MKNFTGQSNPSSREKSKPAFRLFVPANFRTELLARLKGAPLSVYLAYLSHSDKAGMAWPSLDSLATSTGYGVKVVKRAKHVLVQMGLLVPTDQARPDGRFGRKRFRIATTVGSKGDHGTEVSKSTHGTVGSFCPSTVGSKSTQEGLPSEGTPVKAAARGAAAVKPVGVFADSKAWEAIGLNRPMGPRGFRVLWQRAYAAAVDGDLAAAMGSCADAWEAGRGTVPGPFFAALDRIRKASRVDRSVSAEPEAKPQDQDYEVSEEIYV